MHPISTCAIVVLLSLGIHGCTAYNPDGFGGGYSDTPLAANRYRVDVRGNGVTSAGRVRTIALVRAADVTLQNGFQRFVILASNDAESRHLATLYPGEYRASTTGVGVITGPYGARQMTYTGTTRGTYQPPTQVQITKHRATFEILMLKSRDAGFEDGLDANQIIARYGKEVGR